MIVPSMEEYVNEDVEQITSDEDESVGEVVYGDRVNHLLLEDV